MTSIDPADRLLATALAAALDVVREVTPADLGRPTPCTGWDLRALLGHVVGQHRGFAAAVRDGDAPVESFRPGPPSDDDVTGPWHASAQELAAAIAHVRARGDADRPVRLAELGDRRFPLDLVVGFQVLDTVVHTWDVARALGRDHRPAAPLVAHVLAAARLVPDGPARRRPGATFAPPLCRADGSPDGADDWGRALALLGRAPNPAAVPARR